MTISCEACDNIVSGDTLEWKEKGLENDTLHACWSLATIAVCLISVLEVNLLQNSHHRWSGAWSITAATAFVIIGVVSILTLVRAVQQLILKTTDNFFIDAAAFASLNIVSAFVGAAISTKRAVNMVRSDYPVGYQRI